MKDKKKKKGSYTRPEGWEKTIKSSYWDKDKTFAGEKYEDLRKKEDKSLEKRDKAFSKIREFFNKKKKK